MPLVRLARLRACFPTHFGQIDLVMSSYSSLFSLSPADWVGGGGGGEEDMAAAAVSSYLSFDAVEYYCHPPEVDYCVSGEAGSNNGGREASEQSQTDAAVMLGSPAGHAATRDKINEGSSTSGDGSRRGKIAFKTRSDVDVLIDGYRWRKYGKKMVKNSPNPRNYYRCSSEGCHVKKRVERERDDARFVITTYDGVHNHPAASSSTTAYDRLGEQRVEEGHPWPIRHMNESRGALQDE